MRAWVVRLLYLERGRGESILPMHFKARHTSAARRREDRKGAFHVSANCKPPTFVATVARQQFAAMNCAQVARPK